MYAVGPGLPELQRYRLILAVASLLFFFFGGGGGASLNFEVEDVDLRFRVSGIMGQAVIFDRPYG